MPNVSRQGNCRLPDCERPIFAKRMCKTHYARQYRARNPEKYAAYNAVRRAGPSMAERKAKAKARAESQTKQCEQCGALIRRTTRYSETTWRQARFCSRTCTNIWSARQQRPTITTVRRWAARWEQQREREDTAELRDQARSQAERKARRERRIKRATRPLRPARQFIMGWCPDCGKANVVTRGWWHDSIRCRPCTIKRWRLNHIERAKENGVEWEDVASIAIFKRDRYRCQICKRKTRGKWPAPTSPTIDHIIPLSKGGPHLKHNLQTACLRCNVKKGTGAMNEQLRLAI